MNPSFFKFIKNVNMGLIEDELNEHFLSSSSSLKNKEVLDYLGGGKIWEVGQVFYHYGRFSSPLNMALICILGLPLVFFPFESHVSSYSFESFKREALVVLPCHLSSYSFDSFEEIQWFSSHHHLYHSCPVESMLPSHSLCLHMFKESQLLQFHP